MKVVIMGAGNVATVLGRLIKNAGHTILQVVGKTETHAAVLAQELGCAFTVIPGDIDKNGEIYIAAISDSALLDGGKNWNLNNQLILHTSGALSKEVLAGISVNYGVLYPLQSLLKSKNGIYAHLPLLIDANTAENLDLLTKFAETISPFFKTADDKQRLKMHISAVFVNNFTNHLYVLAADYCKRQQLDFAMLQPLIEETALRLRAQAPEDVQTGPAIRKDIITLDIHLRELSADPVMRNIYLKLSDSIMNN